MSFSCLYFARFMGIDLGGLLLVTANGLEFADCSGMKQVKTISDFLHQPADSLAVL